MKGYRIVLDTETSGLMDKDHQIYTMAAIVIDQKTDKEVERLILNIRPKKNRFPSPYAILTNKLKIFTKKYNDSAITENQAINSLVKLSNKYVIAENNITIKPTLSAYNANFDKFFIEVGMSRAGFKFKDSFNKSVIDPLKTARSQIAKGLLTTAKNSKGKMSAKLTDVAEAIGKPYTKSQAHNSIYDA